MNPKEFAIGLMKVSVEDGIYYYQDVFNTRSIDDVTNPHWKKALDLYKNIMHEYRSAFFEVIRQVSVDTVSSVLAIIDGVGLIEGATDDYTLLYGQEKLNGDLQSLFLVEDERKTR